MREPHGPGHAAVGLQSWKALFPWHGGALTKNEAALCSLYQSLSRWNLPAVHRNCQLASPLRSPSSGSNAVLLPSLNLLPASQFPSLHCEFLGGRGSLFVV